MANPIPLVSASQGTTGTPVTWSDDTVYAGTDWAITDFNRSVLVYDAANVLIATLVFSGSDRTVTQAVTKDQYLTGVLTLTGIGSAPDLSKTINIGLERYTNNALDKLAMGSKCCDLINPVFKTMMKATLYQIRAEKALLYGNGPAYDNYINAAQTYLGL